jgi:hypothetical protein
MASEQRLQTRQSGLSAAEREQTIALLSDRFAHGELEMEEFEERVTLAHRAQAVDELAVLVADLSSPSSEPPPTQALEIATSAPERGEAVAIFGGTRRVGAWSVPRHMHVTAFFGGVELDLRNAQLPPGPIDMDVTAAFGGVHVIVPPSLAVEVHGTAIFGGFEQMDRASSAPDPDVPVVRIRGRAIFGGVSVDTRFPGESSWQAHRRQRQEQRALRLTRRLSK